MERETTVRLYHFSDNYDCSTCGRVNQPYGIQVYENYEFDRELCPGCIYSVSTRGEIDAFERAWAILTREANAEA